MAQNTGSEPPYQTKLNNVRISKTHLPLKRNLEPVGNLKKILDDCHNYIYANEGLRKEQIFNEVLKLMFMKMVDEQLPSEICEFGITESEMEELSGGRKGRFIDRIQKLFTKTKEQFGGIFYVNGTLMLEPRSIAYVIDKLQNLSFTDTPIDVKGIAFQTFVHAHQRGERGEFFTPYPVVALCVGVLNPQYGEMVIDPACGSGLFLVQTMKHVWKQMDEQFEDSPRNSKRLLRSTYADSYIRGIDFNRDLVRVSKMHMMVYGNGHSGIFCANSLSPFDELRKQGEGIEPESFDILMTNPPFGTRAKIIEKNLLRQYSLGHKWSYDKNAGIWFQTGDLLKGQIPEVLFVERCLQLLKEGGRMAIVLPDGELTNLKSGYLREFILSHSRLVGIVSLPRETFTPYGTSIKASVVFLQKLSGDGLESTKKQDYPIMMVVSHKIGYDRKGSIIFRSDSKKQYTEFLQMASVDTDILDIVKAFQVFKKEFGIGF